MTNVLSVEDLKELRVVHSVRTGVLTVTPQNKKFLSLKVLYKRPKDLHLSQVDLLLDLDLAESLGQGIQRDVARIRG